MTDEQKKLALANIIAGAIVITAKTEEDLVQLLSEVTTSVVTKGALEETSKLLKVNYGKPEFSKIMDKFIEDNDGTFTTNIDDSINTFQ